MDKQPTLTLIESLFSRTKDYVDNRLELYKLKLVDKVTGVASAVVVGVALFIIFFIFFIVLNIGIALLIGDLVGKSYLGFLIWAAVYAIVGLVIFSSRNKLIKTPITKTIIGKFFIRMAATRKISNTEDLHKAITELESKVKVQELDIKDDYNQIKQKLSPKRVAKNTFSYLAETPEIQKTMVNTIIGFILGYASKKAAEMLSENALDRTVHNLVNHHITKIENKQPESLLSKGIALFRKHTPHDSPIYPFVRYK